MFKLIKKLIKFLLYIPKKIIKFLFKNPIKSILLALALTFLFNYKLFNLNFNSFSNDNSDSNSPQQPVDMSDDSMFQESKQYTSQVAKNSSDLEDLINSTH